MNKINNIKYLSGYSLLEKEGSEINSSLDAIYVVLLLNQHVVLKRLC